MSDVMTPSCNYCCQPLTDGRCHSAIDGRPCPGASTRDDYYRRAQEEYYYCLWVSVRKPNIDDIAALWQAEREDFMASWIPAWRRSVDRQRELRHTA